MDSVTKTRSLPPCKQYAEDEALYNTVYFNDKSHVLIQIRLAAAGL